MADNGEKALNDALRAKAESMRDQVKTVWEKERRDPPTLKQQALLKLYEQAHISDDIFNAVNNATTSEQLERAKKARDEAFVNIQNIFRQLKTDYLGIENELTYFSDPHPASRMVAGPVAPPAVAPMARPVPSNPNNPPIAANRSVNPNLPKEKKVTPAQLAVLEKDVKEKRKLQHLALEERAKAEADAQKANDLVRNYSLMKDGNKFIKASSASTIAAAKVVGANNKYEAAKAQFEQANTVLQRAKATIAQDNENKEKANREAKSAADSAVLSVTEAQGRVNVAAGVLEARNKELAAARAAVGAAPAAAVVAEPAAAVPAAEPVQPPLVASAPSVADIQILEKAQQKATDDKAVAEADLVVARAKVELSNAKVALLEAQNTLSDDPNNKLKKRQFALATANKDVLEADVKVAVSDKNIAVAQRNVNAENQPKNIPKLKRQLELAKLNKDVAMAKQEVDQLRGELIETKINAEASLEVNGVANSALNNLANTTTKMILAAQGVEKNLVQKSVVMEAVSKAFDAKEPLVAAEAEVKSKTEALEGARKIAASSNDPAQSLTNAQAVTNAEAALAEATQVRDQAKEKSDAAEAKSAPLVNAFNKVGVAKNAVTHAQTQVDNARPFHEADQIALGNAREEVSRIQASIVNNEPTEEQAKELAEANAKLAAAQEVAEEHEELFAEAQAALEEARSQQELAEKEVDEIIDPPKKQADDNKAALTMREFIKAVERSDDLRARAGAQWSRLQKSDFGKALGEAGDRLNKNVKGFSGHHMGEAELLEAALFNMLLLLFEILFGAGKVAKAGVKEVYKQVNRNHLSSQDLRKLSLKDHKAALEEAKKYKYDPANKDKLDAALLKMAQAEATHEKHGSKASEAEYNKLKKDYDGVNKSLIDARKKYVAAKAEHELMSFSDRFKDPTKGQEVNRLEEQVRELEVSELNAYLKIKELDTKTDKISPELEAMKADREAAGFDDTVMNAPREKYKDVQRYGELQENITELNAEKERLGTKAVDLKLELEDCEKNGSKYGANQEAIEAQKTKIQKSIKTNADKMAANATGMRDAMVEMNDLAGRIEADPAQKQMVKAEKTRTEKLFGKRAVEWMVKNLVDVPIPIVSNAAGVAPIAVPVSDPLSKPVISVQAGDNPDEEKPNIWSKIVGKIRSLGRSKPDEASMQLMSLEMGDEESPEEDEDEEAQHKHDASEPEPTAVAGPNPASPVAPSVSSSVDAVPVPPLEDNRNDRELFSVTHSEPALKLTPEPSEISANADKNAEARAAEALRVEAESKRFFEQGNSEPLSVTPRSFQLAQADISPRSPDSLVEQIISIQEQSKQGPMQSPDVIPRFKALMEFGGKHQALLNAKAKIETLEPDATEIDKLKVSLVFLYNASRKDPTSGWTVEDQIGLDQVTRELEGNRDFQEQLKALSENQAKEAEALPKQNARAGSLQAEADRKKPIFPRSLSEGNSPSNSRSEPPPEPPTSGSRIKRSSSR